jgi:hypothetical protein
MGQLIGTLRTLSTASRRTLKQRRDDRGQTAAEYMGIIVVVAAIIAAIIAAGIPALIVNGITAAIGEIAG